MTKPVFNVGDKVVATKTTRWYTDGDVGVVCELNPSYDGSPSIWVDFSGQGNNFVMDDGRWCVGNTMQNDIKLSTVLETQLELNLGEPQ